jgi:hypothetical protein
MLYLPPKSPRKNPSKWDRASSEAGSLPATLSGVRQSLSRLLVTKCLVRRMLKNDFPKDFLSHLPG